MGWRKPQGCDTNTCVMVDTEPADGWPGVRFAVAGEVGGEITNWTPITREEWSEFIAAVKAGQYDLPRETMTFAEAVQHIIGGHVVTRVAWEVKPGYGEQVFVWKDPKDPSASIRKGPGAGRSISWRLLAEDLEADWYVHASSWADA